MPAAVRELGAVAGLAGVAGLVVLSALHISQARDIRRLREWAAGQPRDRPSPRRRRAGMRSVVVALAGLLALVVAAAALTGRDGAGDSGGAQAHSDGGRSIKPRSSRPAVEPGDVTVAVLNGTTVPGLAAALRERLAVAGFRKGLINVFSDQQLAESVVQYAPGHETEAQGVGRMLGISRREPVTADSRALAGDATVIVIAGADRAP